jgi:fructose-bisphosphate aldolase class II
MLRRAIALGISKINVNTECQMAFAAAVREYIEQGKDRIGTGYSLQTLLSPGVEAIQRVAMDKMMLFGSVGKA